MKAAVWLLSLLLVASLAATASSATAPQVRVAPGETLTIVGAGFAPRVLVRLRLAGPGIARQTTVRAGRRGGFTRRFPGLGACSVDEVTASAGRARARVPTPWFIKECPPPPPLAP
ncbi:MAG TPA: hypothetical protein VFO26_12695 [Gaiella sp.]|uniref:hypothetical protein n=1 Tax=Gaiella sp. TaxID=2663207 RepID=UPI002D7EEB9B|nr:hypothetical protein [Gaiella sp.]HET9288404.1 hypothetical protein [Gaiella sp.]